jgi:ornithine cyclodeaminase/alanine dehydrogenase-like protein (mu-crystallin family)
VGACHSKVTVHRHNIKQVLYTTGMLSLGQTQLPLPASVPRASIHDRSTIMSESLLVLSSLDVDKITTTFSPDDLLTLTESVFTCLSSRSYDISAPHRTSIQSANHTALFMPSRINAIGTAIKVVSVPTSDSSDAARIPCGLPASTIVLDEHTGAVKALVNARSLTALRTAAGSV